MAQEVINLDLFPHLGDPHMRHAPSIWHTQTGSRVVLATLSGFEKSSGLFIAGQADGYDETDWNKTGVPSGRRKMFGMVSRVTNVEYQKGLTELPEDVAAEDIKLHERLVHAAEATTWLAVYGYREAHRNNEIVNLPAYGGALYLGVELGSVPTELEAVIEIRKVSYPGITRTSGYDNPAYYQSLRKALPLLAPAVTTK